MKRRRGEDEFHVSLMERGAMEEWVEERVFDLLNEEVCDVVVGSNIQEDGGRGSNGGK